MANCLTEFSRVSAYNPDFDTEAVEHLTQLQGDVASAENDERTGQFPQLHRLVVGQQVTGQKGHIA